MNYLIYSSKLKKFIQYLLKKFYIGKTHSFIIIITLVIMVFNTITDRSEDFLSGERPLYLDTDSNKLALLLDTISSYTLFDKGDVDINLTSATLLNKNNEFLSKDDTVLTEQSKLEIQYEVQNGDTISGIAQKFNKHVATILEYNQISIDNAENLKSGQKLLIPAQDTSTSQEWLVKINEKKEQERQIALKKEQEQKKKLAATRRSTIYRERTSSEYGGNAGSNWGTPTSYKYISRGIQRGHTGIDMVVGVGTSVYASLAGKVIEVTGGWGSGYGKSIVVDHGGGRTSRYAHLSDFAVSVGQNVNQGQIIGYSGNTGWSTGPHLHFEARVNGTPINPF